MIRRSFQAIGTQWQILVDADSVSEKVWREIAETTVDFEQRFSRFLPTSEVVQWRDAPADTYSITSDFSRLLRVAQQLKEETGGLFDPAVGGFLEEIGYDSKYRLIESNRVEHWRTPQWYVKGSKLTIDGPVVFDLGGFAKGTLIDAVFEKLNQHKIQDYIVDGGGDLRATQKQSGAVWNTAVEWPGKPGIALCSVPLRQQSLAVSDIFQRSWGSWHHLIHPHKKVSASAIIGCAVLADTAELADSMTTCLALLPESERLFFAKKHKVEFVLVTEEQRVIASENWPGNFFF